MSKEAAVKPAKAELKAPAVTTSAVEQSEPLAAQTAAPGATKQLATAAAVKGNAKRTAVTKEVAAKSAKKEVAEQSTPAPKAPAKEVKKAPVAAKEKLAEVPKVEKTLKAKKPTTKKPKLVRDSFTMPETDYALFATLKQRVLAAGVEAKKSEILRAALLMLAKLDDAELIKAIGLVERIKTGRPKK